MLPTSLMTRIRISVHALTVAALLAGLIPPPAITSLANGLLPTVPTARAASAAAPVHAPAAGPLAQMVTGSNVLTITKTVSGTGSGPFDLTITGPRGYLTNTTIAAGQTQVLTGLASGIYTVTETAPGDGWTTVYTATTSAGSTTGGASAVVSLQNSNTAIPFTLPALTTSPVASDNFSSNSYSGGAGWSGGWIEDESFDGAGTSNGPSAGQVRVVSGAAQIFNDGRSLARSVTLPTNACRATVSFSYRRTNWTTSGASNTVEPLLVELSLDGGTTYERFLSLTNATTSLQTATAALPWLASAMCGCVGAAPITWISRPARAIIWTMWWLAARVVHCAAQFITTPTAMTCR
ncbi:MAG: hypothetical protein R2911_08480 [Caldilineaceae bacterium]